MSKTIVTTGNGKNRIVPAKPGPCPEGVDPKRWKKNHDNCRRVERLLGIVPFTADAWESVAVALMDSIERHNRKARKPLKEPTDG